ncbi:pilus assembly PilX N-terminal domain-containing protein [candidate division WOR-3 bacterium]|nr:pilus assembly PilX N-terminal domain-containing protein [candidate division WOR-3 bacterium]
MRLIYGNEKGFVLPLGLMFLAIIAIMGTTAVVVTTTDLKIGSNYRASQQAFYAAEAGINVAMSNVEDFIFGDTETLSTPTPVKVDPTSSSGTATYTYQAAKRTSGPLRPRAGYEVGAWAGVGFDLAATGQTGTAQSQIEMLSRATVPIDAYTGGK